MKKQDVLVFITALVMMISCAALSFGQEIKLDEYNLKEYQNQYEKVIDIGFPGQDIKAVGPALEKGNLKAVKYLVETYPGLKLLTTPIKDKYGDGEQTICIAARGGYTDLVNYIAKKEPRLVNVDYYDDYLKGYKALAAAIKNGHADTAFLLLDLGTTIEKVWYKYDANRPVMLVLAAKTFKDKETLEKLIPALLKAGENPYTVTGTGHFSADALYFGAEYNNADFVTILRDEMKKMGKEPVAHYSEWICPGLNFGELYRRMEKSERKNIEFLKSQGIELKLNIEESLDCD